MPNSKRVDPAERLKASHRKNVEAAGPALHDASLGVIIGELMKHGTWPSLADMVAEVQARIDGTLSAQGKIDVADDLTRATLEYLMTHLKSLK